MPDFTRTQLQVFRQDLPYWFEDNRRDLPWRRNRTPYRVWISELMLQQTRADQAVPYYERFLQRFPSLKSLAEAPRSDVLKQWEGLGYYSRAVRAHETAKIISRERGGRFPASYGELLALPGIGPYTAAAVASFAFGLDHAVLDGNVIRVYTRVFARDENSDTQKNRKLFQAGLDQLLPPGNSAAFNEGLMELGALVCTPKKPDCPACPLRRVCKSRKTGEQTRFPIRTKKKKIPHRDVGAGVIVDSRGRILIAQRMENRMLGGMWEFPGGGVEKGESLPDCIRRELKEELGLNVRVGPHLITVPHTFSHFKMDLHAYWVRINSGRPQALECADCKWVSVPEISRNALPRADQKILAALIDAGKPPVF